MAVFHIVVTEVLEEGPARVENIVWTTRKPMIFTDSRTAARHALQQASRGPDDDRDLQVYVDLFQSIPLGK